jgi:hypothetical protein
MYKLKGIKNMNNYIVKITGSPEGIISFIDDCIIHSILTEKESCDNIQKNITENKVTYIIPEYENNGLELQNAIGVYITSTLIEFENLQNTSVELEVSSEGLLTTIINELSSIYNDEYNIEIYVNEVVYIEPSLRLAEKSLERFKFAQICEEFKELARGYATGM